jgi:hypothetical protein
MSPDNAAGLRLVSEALQASPLGGVSWALDELIDGRHCLVRIGDVWIAGFYDQGSFHVHFSEQDRAIAAARFIDWVRAREREGYPQRQGQTMENRSVLCRHCDHRFETQHNAAGACSYHPSLSVFVASTGARDDYREIWRFPCCAKQLLGIVSAGRDVRPDQSPGCVESEHVEETGWRVFISYAREDEGVAKVLEGELERRGHRTWRDRSQLVGGEAWAAEIAAGLEAAEQVIVLLSPHSVASAQVERELRIALNEAKRVIPILIEPCEPPGPIRHINWIDWTGIPANPYRLIQNEFFGVLRQVVVFG